MEEEQLLLESMVRHTIVWVNAYDASPTREWANHETFELTLDDGRVIEFSGWGYDASGGTVRDVTPRAS